MIKKRNSWMVFGISAAMLVLVILALIMGEPSFSPIDSEECPNVGACCIEGFCVEEYSQENCVNSGGTWGGKGSSCEDSQENKTCNIIPANENVCNS
tara:strand:+ start:655 stop:945 length:291 start_codon:yes stop_codon:yes gene_type:complete